MSDRDFIWSEKYRPKSVKDILLPTSSKQGLLEYVDAGEIPHLLFVSGPGRGKTTTAKALCNDIDAEVMYINASNENGIDTLRAKISSFALTRSIYNKPKVVILDEFDYASKQFQAALRSPMEEFAKNVRFILTANYESKIIPALISRCTVYNFNIDSPEVKKEMIVQVAKRLVEILKEEGVHYEKDAIIALISKVYPDIRKLIGLLQKFSSDNNGVIDMNILNYQSAGDELIELIFAHKWTDARQYCMDKNIVNEVFSFLYKNLLPKLNGETFAQALFIIGEYEYKANNVPDSEIQVACCLMDLIGIV